ncbi:hypothetical protein ILP92_15860 [Maribius pontilimi]|uniref:Uncharacterized protein n=1 Tax=Palleronia pontilimi TaxID=1964209 RepID=A0A934MIF9_9RHOB|nr:hypothetical protein [Palleronia pontilimi]MBJ3764224.1 hypothetical protein [Palleronia pontilimi]
MRWIILLALLAACDSPSLRFRDAPATRVSVDGSVFSVRVKGERAESLRLSRERRPRVGATLARAEAAIGQASGCQVKRIDGDQAIQRATLDCAGQPGEPPPLADIVVIAVER